MLSVNGPNVINVEPKIAWLWSLEPKSASTISGAKNGYADGPR